MASPELIEETNALLKRFLGLAAERERVSNEFRAGLPEAKDDNFEERFRVSDAAQTEAQEAAKKAREESARRIAESTARELAYRERVLEELTKQTSLMEQIAEKLGA